MKTNISRRNFLKISAAACGTLAIASVMPLDNVVFPKVEFAGQIFRGAAGGRLHYSADGGKTWQAAAKFGEHCMVNDLKVVGARMEIVLETQGCPFRLHSQDGFRWRTG